MFKNNQFSGDTHWEHLHRSQLCATASATHEAELGLRASWVADIATHATDFEAQLDTQNLEDAEYHGAVADMKSRREALYELVSSARWMIKTIIDDPDLADGDRKLINDVFDIEQPLESKSYERLYEAVEDILTGQQKLEDMGASWKLPDAMITNLTDSQSGMKTASETLKIEHGEKLKATEDLYTMRTTGENLLRNVFRWCVAVWGDDDERLLEFGFVPKSQIWTEDKPPHPKNFIYDDVTLQFTWDAVEGVTEYEIDYRLTGGSGDWTQLYKGADTSTANKPPDPGEYDFRIRSWAGDDSGAWSGSIVVNFPEGGLETPTGLLYDEFRNQFTWNTVPTADKYDLELEKDGETFLYQSANNRIIVPLAFGIWKAKVRAKHGEEISDWSVTINIDIAFAPPEQFKYIAGTQKFTWNAVVAANIYELQQEGSWDPLYMGAATEFVHEAQPGEKFRVRAGNDVANKWGEWSAWLAVSA